MHKWSMFVMLLILLAAFASADETKPLPSVKLPPALDRVLRDYERAWQARDPDALAALFAEDGFVLTRSKPPARKG